MRLIVGLIVALFFPAFAGAQIQPVQVKFSQPRNLYLQYEPINLTVTLTNVTDEPLLLPAETDGKAWLSFLVFSHDDKVVAGIKNVEVDSLSLEPGESKRVTVNILPYYGIRATGMYSTQAVINIPGLTPIMTGKLFFTVGKGETIWRKELIQNGTLRVYSLVKFLEVNDSNLYLRVEEPAMNLVYNCTRLGKVVSFAEPEAVFDALGHLHVVQVVGSRLYRYTTADAEGHLLLQEDRNAIAGGLVPTVQKLNDGTVQFVGGFTKETTGRAKLSETQGGLMAPGD